MPPLLRITNTFSVVVTTAPGGTRIDPFAFRTGHVTSAYIPGASAPAPLLTSNSTDIVRVRGSSDRANRATVPVPDNPP